MPIKSEFPDVPLSDQPFAEVLLDALWKHVVEKPDAPALIDGENPSHRLSYADVYTQSLAIAAFLGKRNFGHGRVACVVSPNCIEYLPICVGISHSGGVISGASAAFTEFELTRQMLDCGASFVFAHASCLPTVLQSAKKCPKITTVVVIPSSGTKLDNLPFGVISYDEAKKTKPNLYSHKVDIDVKRDICLLPYSSGTTGAPKGVMLSNQNLVTQIYQVSSHFNQRIIPKLEPYLNGAKSSHDLLFLPFYHIYGFVVLVIDAYNGDTGVVLSKFNPHTFCKCIQDYKIRFLKVVPPILVFLAKHAIPSQYDLSSVLILMAGAAPAGREICEDVMRKMPNVKFIAQAYGMTEVSAGSHLAYIGETPKFGNAGKLTSNLEMKVIDPDTGREVSRGERGEICIKGPTVMLGYLHRPQATAETIDDDGWLHTGDIGYVDDEGFLFIVDRLKELIKVKGLQVPPAELEDLLLTHPSIQDAAVIGIPHEKDGEHPMAFVVKANDSLTEDEVKDFVKSKVSRYKQLQGGVQFIKEIPKAASGKILRRFLRDEAEAIRNAKRNAFKI